MLKMFGMNVASNRCQMIRMTNIVIPIRSCVANINQDVFIVQLDNVVRLPALVNYTLTVYGISLASNTLYSYSNFSIMDASGNSAIENTTMILIPTNQIDFPIIINQVSFGKDNPLVHNTMQVYFTLPRELYKD